MSEDKTKDEAVKKENNKKYWQFFWRSWAIQTSWNYERQMNLGFLYGIAPTLNRIYKDSKDIDKKKVAYERHLAFYNCTPQRRNNWLRILMILTLSL